jgi:tetratricopeptide (TPR) repeat protein
MNSKLIIVDLIVVLAVICFAAPAQAQFEKANQEYAAGQFKEAANDYEALVKGGEYSANLFYNLGNAYFRVQDFGKAILNYERALALDRNHPEAQANLRIARDEARALELPPEIPDRLLQIASTRQFTVAATIAFWIAMFLLVRIAFSQRRSAGLTVLCILLGAIAAFLAFATYRLETGNRGRSLAIVTAKDIQARVATADSASSVLVLPPGSEIKIESTRGDWIYAVLPNKLRGWIPANSAESVRL